MIIQVAGNSDFVVKSMTHGTIFLWNSIVSTSARQVVSFSLYVPAQSLLSIGTFVVSYSSFAELAAAMHYNIYTGVLMSFKIFPAKGCGSRVLQDIEYYVVLVEMNCTNRKSVGFTMQNARA